MEHIGFYWTDFREIRCSKTFWKSVDKREVHTGFWWGDLREGDYLGDSGVDGTIILKGSSRSGMGAFTGFNWLRIGTGGGLL
jgi:hypothetical protein